MFFSSLLTLAGILALCFSQEIHNRTSKRRIEKHSKRIPGASIEYQKVSSAIHSISSEVKEC